MEKLSGKGAGWDIPLNEKNRFIKVIQYCIDMDQKKYDSWSDSAYEFAKEFTNNPELIEQSQKLFAT